MAAPPVLDCILSLPPWHPQGNILTKRCLMGVFALWLLLRYSADSGNTLLTKEIHKLCGLLISSLENSISDPMVVSTEKQMRVVQNCEGFHKEDTESCQFATFTRRTCLSPVETLRGRKSKSPRWFIYPSGFAHFLADLLIQPVDTCWTAFMCWELGCEGAIYKMLKKTQKSPCLSQMVMKFLLHRSFAFTLGRLYTPVRNKFRWNLKYIREFALEWCLHA